MTSNTFQFLSRQCKTDHHYECSGQWLGLGFEVYCCCRCHTKKVEALAAVGHQKLTPGLSHNGQGGQYD